MSNSGEGFQIVFQGINIQKKTNKKGKYLRSKKRQERLN
jgi:hypothetical protein